jgi:hypothetical protein
MLVNRLLLGCVGHLASYDARTFDWHQIAIVELELSILDDESPYFVALSIGM